MFWSRDYTFYNDKETLSKYRKYLKVLLYIKGRDPKDIQEYLNAYNYFTTHPSEFDGATIVKDLVDFGELDLDAMLHDYDYITGSNRNIVKKFKADLKYIKNSFSHIVILSAATGAGFDELKHAVTEVLGTAELDPAQGILFTERQRDAARAARRAAASR